MIQKLRRKFIAVVMGVAALILLVVFAVLVVTTETGMQRQSMELLQTTLNGGHKYNRYKKEAEAPAVDEPAEAVPPPAGQNDLPKSDGEQGGKRYGQDNFFGRFPCFTATVAEDGTVTVEERASFLLSDFDTDDIEDLARTVAASSEDTGALSSYRLRYAKKTVENGVLVAFADTSAEYNALSELIKNSLFIGAATLLVLFGASVLLARWAIRPVENAWEQQKQFVGDASHELKTPLTVILSNADMILDHPAGDERRWAENIKAEAVRMKKLTEELLSLARSDDTVRKQVMETVDLSYLVTDSILSFEPAVFESGRTLSYEVAEHLQVLGDSSALSQLTAILLDNAIKYSPEGGAIAVRLDHEGKHAQLSVTNTGEAIPPEDLTRIFERFYRSDPSRHGDGHGLGLSIARSIAEHHKGKIWAESLEGLNTFTILLPCLKADKN